MAKVPKKLVDLPPKPVHENVDFSNVLPDKWERREPVIDEPYWDDDEDRFRREEFGDPFGFW